jgi:peptidoglycan/LPS O-acetylase OafA/YrhL
MRPFLTRTLPRLFALIAIMVGLGIVLLRYLEKPTITPLTASSVPAGLTDEIAAANADFALAQTTAGSSGN